MPDNAQVILQEALAANRRLLFLLIGLPGSGKTTFARKQAARLRPIAGVRILSTDYFIEKEAKRRKTTYNESFDAVIGAAEAHHRRMLPTYLQTVPVIILDRTHLSLRSRVYVTTLAKRYAPDRLCLAVVMPTSLDDCLVRNARRPSGRAIREDVIRRMHAIGFEKPDPVNEPALVITNPKACLNAVGRGVEPCPNGTASQIVECCPAGS
jgi:predicted kinase